MNNITHGIIINFDLNTGSGSLKSSLNQTVYDFRHMDIKNMTVGPNSFKTVNAGDKVEFEIINGRATNIRKI